jgi:hypothetical protein
VTIELREGMSMYYAKVEQEADGMHVVRWEQHGLHMVAKGKTLRVAVYEARRCAKEANR